MSEEYKQNDQDPELTEDAAEPAPVIGGSPEAQLEDQPGVVAETGGGTEAEFEAEVPQQTEPEPEAGSEPEPDAYARTTTDPEIIQSVERLGDRVEVLATLIKRKDDVIYEMHSDLQKARDGVDLAILRPAFGSLVRLYGDLNADIAQADMHGSDIVGLLRAYQIRIMNAMHDLGLQQEEPTDLDQFPKWDASRQDIASTVDADDPELHQKVARVVLPAFSYDGKVLFRERVEVYRRRSKTEKQTETK